MRDSQPPPVPPPAPARRGAGSPRRPSLPARPPLRPAAHDLQLPYPRRGSCGFPEPEDAGGSHWETEAIHAPSFVGEQKQRWVARMTKVEGIQDGEVEAFFRRAMEL